MCNEEKCPKIEKLQEQNAVLKAENEALKNELEKYKKPPKDSSNSSISPSNDPYRKPYPKREKSNKKPGGQEGHKGETRMLSDTPDEIVEIYPVKCPHCGGVDFILDERVKEKRQEHDIPAVRYTIKEFQQKVATCTHCGKKSFGEFPERIKASVQLGLRTEALIGYLHVEHHQSYERTARILKDLFELNISQGTIKTKLDDLKKVLKPEYDNILENLKKSSVIGSDETRQRINGQNGYTWVFQNADYCLFTSGFSRAFEVIENLIGNSFNGFWVSDRYGAQLKVEAIHQLCLSHLIRNCKFSIQVEISEWSEKLKLLFQEAIKFRKNRGEKFDPLKTNDFREIQNIKQKFEKIFEKIPPKEEEGKLFKGLMGRIKQLLAFLDHPEVPYDNNGSERALRNRVIHRKVTGGFRTIEGARCYDVIASVIETAKRQGKNILDELFYILRKNQPLLST